MNNRENYEIHDSIMKIGRDKAMEFANSLKMAARTNILTSMFPNGFPQEFAAKLKELIVERDCFVFVASDFEHDHERTDKYFQFFLSMFHDIGIYFNKNLVIDDRTQKEEAWKLIENADVVWLAGGDTPAQYHYFESYGLVPYLKERQKITIGMSAGAINMTETAICTVDNEQEKQMIYPALGMVDLSIEPHFERDHVSEELLSLSEKYTIYGLCDEAVIWQHAGKTQFMGEIYRICQREIVKIDTKSSAE